MGLGPDVLHARNPRLIIVRVSGWGQDGPYRDRPGFGSLVEGMSGFAAKNGFADRPPVLPPLALADMIAGLYGASAVLIALREIEVNGGNGQVIDLPLLDPIFSILGPEAAHLPAHRQDQAARSAAARQHPRRAMSSRPATGAGLRSRPRSRRWPSGCSAPSAVADMIDDPRFRTNADRVRNAEACEAPLRDFIGRRTLADALAVFDKAEVTAAPVYDIDQFMTDPHVQAREIVVDVPDADMGSIPMHAVVPRLSGTPGALRTPAPELGEHNGEVLGALGLTDEDLDQLRERRVI